MSQDTKYLRESQALQCELAAEILLSSGSLRFPVAGWSMLPSVFPGDTLLVERVDSSEIAEGDIVVFRRDCRLVGHRVIRSSARNGIVTQGDALSLPDAGIRNEELLGKVVLISRRGKDIKPHHRMPWLRRAIVACVRHSAVAAWMVVGWHSLRQASLA